jgi:hypothetical protein
MNNALFINSVNLLMEMTNSDNHMMHFHKTSAKPLLVLSIPTTRLNHASTCKKKDNAHSVKAAHSSMVMRRRET